jgi:hypothetical protein
MALQNAAARSIPITKDAQAVQALDEQQGKEATLSRIYAD